jgi:hypothetical protein
MAFPLSSSDHNQIQAVEHALRQCISQAEGGSPNAKALSSVQQQIKDLLNNPHIPDGVRQSLQAAANELKQVQNKGGDISHLYSAKMQVDDVLGGGEHKAEGGSLGGGSEGE